MYYPTLHSGQVVRHIIVTRGHQDAPEFWRQQRKRGCSYYLDIQMENGRRRTGVEVKHDRRAGTGRECVNTREG